MSLFSELYVVDESDKTETGLYGVFYRCRGKWIGPYCGELFNSLGNAYDSEKDVRLVTKQKTHIREQIWQEV